LLLGNERHDDFDYPDEEWRYYVLADRFGWTPTQVDEQPAVLVDWLISISGIVREVESERVERQ
jgi:hypothetical protein